MKEVSKGRRMPAARELRPLLWLQVNFGMFQAPVRIVPFSQESLEVHIDQALSGGKQLDLVGKAKCAFDGKFFLSSLCKELLISRMCRRV
jgi:hypothetical protein